MKFAKEVETIETFLQGKDFDAETRLLKTFANDMVENTTSYIQLVMELGLISKFDLARKLIELIDAAPYLADSIPNSHLKEA